MKQSAYTVIVLLLVAIVGYLAIERHERDTAAAADKAFRERITKSAARPK